MYVWCDHYGTLKKDTAFEEARHEQRGDHKVGMALSLWAVKSKRLLSPYQNMQFLAHLLISVRKTIYVETYFLHFYINIPRTLLVVSVPLPNVDKN